jgi:hypothetical protein
MGSTLSSKNICYNPLHMIFGEANNLLRKTIDVVMYLRSISFLCFILLSSNIVK